MLKVLEKRALINVISNLYYFIKTVMLKPVWRNWKTEEILLDKLQGTRTICVCVLGGSMCDSVYSHFFRVMHRVPEKLFQFLGIK